MKTHEDTDRHPTDLKSARMNYPNSTMQPFVLQNASVDFQYPKPALSYVYASDYGKPKGRKLVKNIS